MTMTIEALENVEETGIDPNKDIARVRAGLSFEALLAECLDGADHDRETGWHDYVEYVAAHAFPRFGFECWDDEAKRWDASLCGHQDRSNCFATRAEAEAELPRLASVMGCPVSKLRVSWLDV